MLKMIEINPTRIQYLMKIFGFSKNGLLNEINSERERARENLISKKMIFLKMRLEFLI